MARPQKKGLEYFSVDCHMNDEVNLIIGDYGMTGFGVLIQLFQVIYGNEGYFTRWEEKDIKLFAYRVRVEREEVEKIVNDCVDWNIFNSEKFKEYNILTSRRIQEHYANSTYKRKGVEMLENYAIIDLSEKNHINEGVTDDGNQPTTELPSEEVHKVQYSNSIVTVQKTKEEEKRKEKEVALLKSFDSVYSIYPRKKAKQATLTSFKKLLKKHSVEDLIKSVENFNEDLKKGGDTLIYTSNNFFGQKAYYLDYLPENYNETINQEVIINDNATREMQKGDEEFWANV